MACNNLLAPSCTSSISIGKAALYYQEASFCEGGYRTTPWRPGFALSMRQGRGIHQMGIVDAVFFSVGFAPPILHVHARTVVLDEAENRDVDKAEMQDVSTLGFCLATR